MLTICRQGTDGSEMIHVEPEMFKSSLNWAYAYGYLTLPHNLFFS